MSEAGEALAVALEPTPVDEPPLPSTDLVCEHCGAPCNMTEYVTRVVDGWAAPGGLGQEKLTRKELLVTHLLLRGYMVDELATMLGNTAKTMKCHITSIYRKLGIQARHELFARVFGIDDMPMPESAWQNQNPRCPQV